MGKITILPETTKDPITLIGQRAGVCWNADTCDVEKNYKRGMDCILANHGRVLEFVNVEMIIDGYSARAIREWYTHIGGAPTRLQASTRYIDYEDKSFSYICPPSILNNEEGSKIYFDAMDNIQESLRKLSALDLPREDVAMLLPLGMTTKIVDRRNLRNLVDMSHQRMCTRAYWEYRLLLNDICNVLREYSCEWEWIVDNLFKPKCDVFGYCTEKKSCGRKDKKEGE